MEKTTRPPRSRTVALRSPDAEKKKKRTGVDQRVRPTNTPQAKIGRKPTRGTSFLLQFSTPLSHSLSPCRLSQRGINEPFPGKGKTRWPLPAMKRRRSESFVFKKALDRRDLSWTVLRARRPCRPPRPLPFLARPKFRLRFFFGVGGGGHPAFCVAFLNLLGEAT